jgi:hypothetical protein
MRFCFFDTSALQHRYVSSPFSRLVRSVLSRRTNRCYILDISVLEIASALGKQCRVKKLGLEHYDRFTGQLFGDLGSERITVRQFGDREIVRARHLLRFAGVIKTRNLGSNDALIAASCLELSLELQKPVTFYLSDWGLFSVLQDLDAFKSALRLKFVGIPKAGAVTTT